MPTIVWLHVAGGGVGLLAGFVALYAAKGSTRHRAIGRVFVYAMLIMALSGAGIAAVTKVETSIVMGTFTAYLVFTGLTAVRPLSAHPRASGLTGAGVAFMIAIALADLGRRAYASPEQAIEGLPAIMAGTFAAVAGLAGISDIRALVSPPLTSKRKLTRHLWRMCFALFIAAASFFLGQTQVIPPTLRSPVLLAVPVLTPLVVMGFWLWRMRASRIDLMVARSHADAA